MARVVGSPDWRPLMGDVRRVAAGMAAGGEIVVTSKGEPVTDAASRGGPVRYRGCPALLAGGTG